MSRFQYILLLLFPLWILTAQDSYIGPVTFDYSGDQNGAFESVLFDTIPTGGALTATNSDSIWVSIFALDQTAPDTFDLFIAFMQDTASQIHPRSWDIFQSDPDNIEFLMVYAPGIDSSFISQFSTFSSDSSSSTDSINIDSIITSIIQELMDDVYISIGGGLEIETASDSAFSGSFYGTFLKGEITWPLPQINISNGSFTVDKILSTALTIKNTFTPDSESFSLDYPYPNPFNPSTTIHFYINQQMEFVTLNIYDISGNHIETLIQKSLNSGRYSIQWNAQNYSSGIYFAVLSSNYHSLTQKLYLIK